MERIIADCKKVKDLVDERLHRVLLSDEPLLATLDESIRYTLFSGGKRIRPLFCFMVGEIFDVPSPALLPLACSLEMIHTASLIMDDLPHMDDASIRRGKPSNHVIFGQDVSALASIGLLTKAFEVVITDPELEDFKKSRVVSRLAQVVGIKGMVGGQFVDLKFSHPLMDYSTLEFIIENKTAALFVASGATAAIIGNAREEEIRALEAYARHLGFAFQILDDLLDAIGEPEEVGKSVRNDRCNFTTFYGIEGSRQRVQEHTTRAFDAIRIFDGRGDKLIALGQMLLGRRS